MSTMSYRKPYPPELRREAVELVRSSGRPIKQVACELDVSCTRDADASFDA
jgi:transposase-like protein